MIFLSGEMNNCLLLYYICDKLLIIAVAGDVKLWIIRTMSVRLRTYS